MVKKKKKKLFKILSLKLDLEELDKFYSSLYPQLSVIKEVSEEDSILCSNSNS